MPVVSIVIPNYNGAEHLSVCLDSIKQQSFTDYEVIVVDNGSTDESTALLNARGREVSVYRFSENRGFAAAVNHGIHNSRGEFIALVNNDIELDSRWLEHLIDAIKSDSQLGSVACKMLNFFERAVIDAAGDVLTRAGNIIGRGSGEIDHGQFDEKQYVFGVCAGAGIYRREVFERVGLYDEDFFAWFEDADHSFRSQITGYKCMYIPAAVCYHKRGATAKQLSAFAVRLHARNHLYYLIKNIPIQIFWKNIFYISASRLRNWFTIVLHGDLRALLWAIGRICVELPRLLKKRKLIQKSRTVSLSYLQSLFYQ